MDAKKEVEASGGPQRLAREALHLSTAGEETLWRPGDSLSQARRENLLVLDKARERGRIIRELWAAKQLSARTGKDERDLWFP